MTILLWILLVALIVYIAKGILIVQQQEVVIIERLGKYQKTLESGLNFIIPVLEAPRGMSKRVTQRGIDGTVYSYSKDVSRIDLRETVFDFPRQNVITKDNVTITINALLYYQIVDAKKAVYAIANLPDAIEKLTQTTLRNLVGQLDLDETLVSRDKINQELRAILDEATNKWGVKVNRVELQDIIPPADIQSSMEKQMKAERDRRAAILEAEGLKKSAILKAEGQKEAAINQAEGEKQAAILRAEGVAQARVIEADAEKEAIQRIINALADKGQPDKYLIAMKYLETLSDITAGENNKVVYMPYEATGILSSVDGIKQMFDKK
ncbi:TPA: SPFH/Band 7/PHB domain protein [Candidatus Scatousia excrementigallinarum]|uniref:SPFH/Band 7/PHB domain protein n=1 Tax=Candidatus Scatousia excrementigallinarum TaxID=2840935 RepID=A0A9D1F141_9BACT|nr:SPFH/Band 7/PHB domain protein [Candidatus Scatousia excrementigallinarum]